VRRFAVWKCFGLNSSNAPKKAVIAQLLASMDLFRYISLIFYLNFNGPVVIISLDLCIGSQEESIGVSSSCSILKDSIFFA
jgi:hypothetical protein